MRNHKALAVKVALLTSLGFASLDVLANNDRINSLNSFGWMIGATVAAAVLAAVGFFLLGLDLRKRNLSWRTFFGFVFLAPALYVAALMFGFLPNYFSDRAESIEELALTAVDAMDEAATDSMAAADDADDFDLILGEPVQFGAAASNPESDDDNEGIQITREVWLAISCNQNLSVNLQSAKPLPKNLTVTVTVNMPKLNPPSRAATLVSEFSQADNFEKNFQTNTACDSISDAKIMVFGLREVNKADAANAAKNPHIISMRKRDV